MNLSLKQFLFFYFILFHGCIKHSSTEIKEGTSKWSSGILTKKYYSGGRLDSSEFFYEKNLLEKIVYFETGKINQYFFYSIAGDCCYFRSYGEKGELIDAVGEPCFYGSTFTDGDTSQFFFDIDTVKTFFFAPTLPDCSTKFFVVIEDSLYPYVYKMDDSNCGYYTIKDPYKKGYWEVCFAMKFFDPKENYKIKKVKCQNFIVKGH